jgi:hypothetical protein
MRMRGIQREGSCGCKGVLNGIRARDRKETKREK